ncbi:Charged multivesicular body protein 4C [Cichlidogyrus casuarinus]|uniref:Charged multivesicular body protein 4C n=1 Tax=Cichlidogyrus casuarinus TaxID=1844966 RepID=A0ABD2QLE3_9PLAT
MSALSRMFGGSKAQKETPQAAMLKIQETVDILTKKQEYLETQIEKEVATARKFAKTNRRAALNALKKKKMYTDQLAHLDGTIATLESQRANLDNASLNMEAMKAMQTATSALKNAHKNMDLDQVNKIKDEIDEQQEIARTISEEISRPAGQDMFDEDELLAELNELEGEADDDAILNRVLDIPEPSSELPSIPSSSKTAAKNTSQSKKTTDEEDQIAALSMWSN